jgi:hypothetical protein
MAAIVNRDRDSLPSLGAVKPVALIPAVRPPAFAGPAVVGFSSESVGFDFRHGALSPFKNAGTVSLPRAKAPGETAADYRSAPGRAVAALASPTAKRVFFSPFRVSLYSRKGGGLLSSSGEALKPEDVPLLVGRYLFTLNASRLATSKFVESDRPIPFKALGKRMILEKLSHDPAAGTLKLQVQVVENIVWMIPVLIAAAAAVGVGVAGFGIGNAVESVDKVLVDTSSAWWKWGLIIAAVVVGYWFLKKRPGFLGG